jgi:hypothetical protein
MRLAEYAQRLSDLAATAARLDSLLREKVALYAEEITARLGRAATVLATLELFPEDRTALLAATRELGRVSGLSRPSCRRLKIILTAASTLALNGALSI